MSVSEFLGNLTVSNLELNFKSEKVIDL
jgi:hypothetical protein